MDGGDIATAAISEATAAGCAFILATPASGGAGPDYCGVPCRPGSPYCPRHHALCHLPSGSAAERRQFGAIEALAGAVGGRHGRAARRPPPRLLRRLERLQRDFSRSKCS